MTATFTFDLVPARGALQFDGLAWEKAKFHLLEFIPAKHVALIGDPPAAIRVTAIGSDAEIAPALLARVAELAGTDLRVAAAPTAPDVRWWRRRGPARLV